MPESVEGGAPAVSSRDPPGHDRGPEARRGSKWFDRIVGHAKGIACWYAKDAVPLTFLLAFSVFTVVENFGGAYTVNFIDNSWPMNPWGSFNADLYVWNPQQMGNFNLLSTGALPLTLWDSGLQALHLSPGIQELVTIVGLQWLAGASFFLLFDRYLLRRAGPTLRRPLSVAAALACLVNLSVQTVYWWDFLPLGFEILAFGGAFLFLLTGELDRFLTHQPPRTLRILALGACGTIAFSVNVPFNLSFLVLSLYLPVLAVLAAGISVRPFGRLFLFEVLTIVLIGALSLWWLLPSAQLTLLQPAYVVQQSASINSLQVFQSSTAPITLLNVLEGNVGYPVLAIGHYGLTYALATRYAIVLLALPLAGIILGLLEATSWQRAPLILAVLALFAQGLIVTGVNSPLYPVVFDALFRSPVLLTALRTPFVALGESVEVGWVVALALSAAALYERLWGPSPATPGAPKGVETRTSAPHLPRWAASPSGPIIAVVLVGVLFVPVFAAAPSALAGDAVPIAPYEARTSVAAYEMEVASYLRGQLDGHYALLFPGGFLEQNWTHGYDGYDVLPSLLPGAFLIDNYREGFVVGNNTLLTDVYASLQSDEPNWSNLSGLLERIGVKDVVIEGALGGGFPFGQSFTPDYPKLLAALNGTAGLVLDRRIGPDYIYTVSQTRGLVYLASGSLSDAGLLEGSVVPRIDLTGAFRVASTITTPSVPYQWEFALTNGSGLDFGASASAKANANTEALAQVSALPSPLTLFNGVPLNLTAAPGDCLVLNFSTNNATAISVTLVTSPTLLPSDSATIHAGEWSVEGPASSLGDGDSSLVPSYGAGHFTSPGRSTILVDRLTDTLSGSPTLTIRYILISLWPVLPSGSGIRGGSLQSWPGTQWVHIGQLALGQDLFLDPAPFSTEPFDTGQLAGAPASDLTSEWTSGVLNRTPSEPLNPVPALLRNGGVELYLNSSLRQQWSNSSGSLLYRAYGQPSWYNQNCLAIDPAAFPYLSLNLTAAAGTAFTAQMVANATLGQLTPGELDSSTRYLGGAASPQGDGDPLLLPAYGALHFVTNGTARSLVDNLVNTYSGAGAPPLLCHLFLSIYFVAPDGTGVRGLPVESWMGTQSLAIHSLVGSRFLVHGDAPHGPAPNLTGTFLATAYPPPAAGGAGVVVISGPELQFARGAELDYTEVNPSEFRATVWNDSAAPLGGPVLVVFAQSFHAGWVLGTTQGVQRWTHYEVDSSINGYLIFPANGTVSLSMTLQFGGQGAYSAALLLGPSVPLALAAAVWSVPRVALRSTRLRRNSGR